MHVLEAQSPSGGGFQIPQHILVVGTEKQEQMDSPNDA